MAPPTPLRRWRAAMGRARPARLGALVLAAAAARQLAGCGFVVGAPAPGQLRSGGRAASVADAAGGSARWAAAASPCRVAALLAAGAGAAAAALGASRLPARVKASERMRSPDFDPTPPEGMRQVSGGVLGDHDVIVVPDQQAVQDYVCRRIADALKEAIGWRGRASLALPGGSVMAMMGGLTDAVHGGSLPSVEWDKVTLAYVNHKCVPLDDAKSNHQKALDTFAKQVGIPAESIIVLGGSSDGVAEAVAYEKKLLAVAPESIPRDEEGTPVFDVLALGMGADGHVGSLYPNRSEITRREGYVLHVEQEGKPPSITLSLPVMNAAKEVIVCALGEKKAEAIKKALKEDAGDEGRSFPAQAIHPKEDSTWILDEPAAGLL